jgi:hypothetical protein
VNDRSRLGSLRVQADARGLVSRSGTALVAELAARLGVVGELSGALCDLHRRRPVHDPGAVLCDLATMLIDGGDCISDLGALADQPDLLGRVASHSTVSRLLHALGEDERGALRVARGSLAPYAALEAGARGGWVPARGCLGGRADRPGGSQRLAAGGAADLSQGAPRPGAQLRFTDVDGHRYQCFITDQPGRSLAKLELRHRLHARVEDRVQEATELGLGRLPFQALESNQTWFELVLLAQDLLAWLRQLVLSGELSLAKPKRLRHRLLHVARAPHALGAPAHAAPTRGLALG